MRNRIPGFIIVNLFIIAGLIGPGPPLFAEETSEIRYEVMIGEEKGGEVLYTLTREADTLTLRSVLVGRDGETWDDAEVVMDIETLSPLSSRKSIPYPAGSLEMDTRYQKDLATIHLLSPAGNKNANVPLPRLTYDLEQVPFVFSLMDPSTIDRLDVSILVPISGMTWLGRLRRVDEDETSIRFRFALAGEVLFFRFDKEEPYYPMDIEAPHRGYVLRKTGG